MLTIRAGVSDWRRHAIDGNPPMGSASGRHSASFSTLTMTEYSVLLRARGAVVTLLETLRNLSRSLAGTPAGRRAGCGCLGCVRPRTGLCRDDGAAAASVRRPHRKRAASALRVGRSANLAPLADPSEKLALELSEGLSCSSHNGSVRQRRCKTCLSQTTEP